MTSTKLEFDNLLNVRDLGGMVTKDGRKIKDGKLFRSCLLYDASDKDKEILADKIGIIVDFRSDDEIASRPDPEIEGVAYLHLPAYDNTMQAGQNIQKTAKDPSAKPFHDADRTRRAMAGVYMRFAENEFTVGQFGTFLHILLDKNYKSVLWHCTAGKDRTGFATAILLKILGVDDASIVEDYMLTNQYWGSEVEKAKQDFRKENGYLLPENERALEYLHLAWGEYVTGTLDRACEIYGDFDHYVSEGLHLTEAEIAQLKEMYLE